MDAQSDRDLAALQARVSGRYSIERELGRGGMGIVYLAHEVALDRRVALKLLPAELAAAPAFRDRFLREARLAARLSHPNIVPIHAVEAHPDAVFFAMGYVEGETLGARLGRVGSLPPAEVAGILREVAWALAYAHGRGVVHRDIKPDNILIERGTGRAFMMDFGIAWASDATAGSPALTEVGQVVGTAAFMSPEQASGDVVDGRSDLYSLGAVGFFALTGRPPFVAATSQQLLAKQVIETAPPVGSVRSGLPPTLATVVDRLLAKAPEQRFPTGEAVAEALGNDPVARAEVAAPLRSFVRAAEQNAIVLSLLVPLIGIALLRPAVALSVFFMGLAIVAGPVLAVGLAARRVFRMGYRFADVAQAFVLDARARDDERRQLAAGNDPAATRRATRRALALTIGGIGWFAAIVLLLQSPLLASLARSAQLAVILVAVAGLVVAMFGFLAMTQVWLGARTASRPTRPSRFWQSGAARVLFGLAVRGVRAAPARDPAGALDDLLDETERAVPPTDRAAVRDTRRRLAALGAAASGLRDRDAGIERAIAETGADATERLRTARVEVAGELARTIGAIDRLRSRLILVRAGVAGVAELAEPDPESP